jgi:hypothetical protein
MRLGIAALALAAVGLLASPARADLHKDEELGWTLQIPRGWNRIPLPPEETWVVAKYLCDRTYPTKDGGEQTPEIKVIYFPAGRDMKVKEKRVEEEVGKGIKVISTERNYRDFKDYLKENNSGTGFYISKEEETKVGGIPATWLEIKWEKLTTPRRALAVIFHRDVGADYAVTFEVLEEQWDKLGRELANAVRTFRFIEAKRNLRADAAAGTAGKDGAPGKEPGGKGADGEKPGGEEDPAEPEKELTPEELERKWEETNRQERRRDLDKEVNHFRANLPKGWREVKSKNFICFTHADDKYTRRALDQAEGMRAWTEKTFGSLGKGEISPLVIRVCETYTEENSFRDTSRGNSAGSWGGGINFTCNQEEMAQGASTMGWLNSWILQNYFTDRNRDVFWSVPTWIRWGLDGFVETGVLAKGRFDFRPHATELVEIRKAVKEGKLLPVRDILNADGSILQGGVGNWYQVRALVRYFLDGPGATDKRTRGKFLEILKVSGDLRREEREQQWKEAKDGAGGGAAEKRPETEEEEEAMSKARQEKRKEEEREYNKKVLDRAFPGWTEADWTAFDRAWRAYAAQYE